MRQEVVVQHKLKCEVNKSVRQCYNILSFLVLLVILLITLTDYI